MMRRSLLRLAALAMGSGVPGWAQMHAVKKPDEVTRAVAVYEWTGEEGKASASRVVPVSLFIDGQFQDAAIYKARPVPFAIDTGTVYEVGRSGTDLGTLELTYERHLTAGDSAEIDDGWLGYGEFKVKPKETLTARKQSGTLPKLVVGGKGSSGSVGADSGSATGNGRKGTGTASASTGSPTSAGTSSPASDEDADSPTLHRRAGSEDDSTASAPGSSSKPDGTGQSGNPTPAASQTASKSGSGTGSDADDAAERPTLKRRTPAEVKAKQKQKDSARVVAGNNLNDDPDRPTLHRGSKTESDEEAVPPLRGLPKDMKQLVAVSDAKDRPEHDFVRAWESAEERAEVLKAMQDFAREQLAGYKGESSAAVKPPAAGVSAATRKTPSASARAAKLKAASSGGATAPAAPLVDESLKGYTLSYGGAATYIYSATSTGADGAARYVSVVAQEVPVTGLKVALASVTDATHLDRTPWMRFVDVVDADASNRASLLMELRAQHTRQFALYRVIGARADQTFLSGSTE